MHKSIQEAIASVYKEVGYVQKTGVNSAQKYKYAGEADLIAALRPVMMENGITVVPAGVHLLSYSGYKIGDRKTNRIVGVYKFDFVHAESKTSLSVEVVGEGVDSGDKAAYKAATGALKYALRQTFLIETGDEPEAHEVEEKPVFKNASLRNTFFNNVVKSWEDCVTVEELEERKALDKEKLDAMKVGNEHDQLAAEELKKRYVAIYKKLKQGEEMLRQADKGNFDNIIEE